MKSIKKQLGYTAVELMLIVQLLIVAVLGVGWIMNIVTIVGMLDAPVTGMFIFRCIGVVVMPLGGVLGYF